MYLNHIGDIFTHRLVALQNTGHYFMNSRVNRRIILGWDACFTRKHDKYKIKNTFEDFIIPNVMAKILYTAQRNTFNIHFKRKQMQLIINLLHVT